MRTLGWVFLLIFLLVVRGITRGRTLPQIATDLGDEFNAIITSDPAKLSAALGRTGSSASASVAVPESALGVPASNPTDPATGTNPYDVHAQMTRQAYNAAHPTGTGSRTSGGQVVGP